MKAKKIKVIDLFAGPGGLGEGFSSCSDNSPFQIAMSVEHEKYAHRTLTLRAFYRKLTKEERNKFYYPYIESHDESEKMQNFQIMIGQLKKKWSEALYETMGGPCALGNPEKWKKIKAGEPLSAKDDEPTEHELLIMKRIDEIRKEHKGPLVVIGGPPCQAYSVNGRNRVKAEKDYSPESDERFFLYQEYLKVLDRADPDIFVMENVEGILTAKLADGKFIFEKIKQELVMPERIRKEQYDIYSFVKEPDQKATTQNGPVYIKNSDYVITASKYGVPQNRKRVILLGIKHKYGLIDDYLELADPPPKTADLLTGLPILRSGMSDEVDDANAWLRNWYKHKNELITLLSEPRTAEDVAFGICRRKLESSQLSRYQIFRMSGTIFTGDYLKLRSHYLSAYSKTLKILMSCDDGNFVAEGDGRGNNLFCRDSEKQSLFTNRFRQNYPDLYSWLNRDIQGAVNHVTRGHMKEDLKRYMFSAAWASAHEQMVSPSPKSKDFPLPLSPEHGNWNTGNHADRFRTVSSQTVPYTITSHLRKDGHAQIHYDLAQNRSLTVREAARIQTFPDDYYFEGSQGWQYQQVGNAVPAYLAKKIALHVFQLINKKIIRRS